MRLECPSCKSELEVPEALMGRGIDCPVCKTRFVCTRKGSSAGSEAVPSAVGVERLGRFRWGEFASEIFKRHSDAEIERYFMVGTESTTPDIFGVKVAWPKPWVFARLLVVAVGLYWGMVWLWDFWSQKGAYGILEIPNIIMVGSLAVPLAAAILFFEMNIRKNVSLYQVLRLIFVGGVLSIVITDFLNPLRPTLINTFGIPEEWHSAIAGPLEETAKLLAVIFLARGGKYRYTLNGLLFGAAVGVGFAIFESAGYAFRCFLMNLKAVSPDGLTLAMSKMRDVIFLRGVLSPIGHVAYSAIAVGALWRVKGGDPFAWSLFGRFRFLFLFACAVALHAFWNSPLLADEPGLPYAKIAIVAVVSWTLIRWLVQDGIKQIQREQESIVECDA